MIGYELSEEDLKSFAVQNELEFKSWKDTMLSERVTLVPQPSRTEIYRVSSKRVSGNLPATLRLQYYFPMLPSRILSNASTQNQRINRVDDWFYFE